MRLASVLAVALCCAAPAHADDALAARVDALAAEALQRPVAGLSVAVGRRGRVILAKGYGLANVELQAPASADTVYHIDSITKLLTAAAVLKQADEGRLSLDDDLARWVPGFSTPERTVRIRNLLAHTSGLPSYTSQPGIEERERLDSGPDEVLAPIRGLPAHFAPGEGWRYCNTGFYLLGLVLEKAAGRPYAEVMRAQVFEPLGMARTRYGDVKPLIPDRAAGYDVEDGKVVNGPLMSWRLPFSGGAVVSTATDLVRFMDALAHGRLLKPETVRTMWSPTRLADGTALDYGMGTRLGTLAGHRMIGHTGNGGGFKNVLLYFPEDDLAVAVLTNTDAGSPLGLAAHTAAAALGVTLAEKREQPLPAGAAGRYAGTFESDEARVTFVDHDGGLRFRMKDDDALGTPLVYLGDDTFLVHGSTVGRFLVNGARARANAVYTDGLFMDAMMRVP